MLRSQFLLSPADRLEVNSQWGRPDVNQGINIVEYNKKFERLDLNIKLSQVENSVSILSTAYKNLFLGFEAIHVNIPHIFFNFFFLRFKVHNFCIVMGDIINITKTFLSVEYLMKDLLMFLYIPKLQ